MNLDKKIKQVQNLFRALQNNPKSVFYTKTKLTKSFIKKQNYDRDKVFVNLHDELEDKNFYKNENLPLVTLFIDKKTNKLIIQRCIVFISPLKCYMQILLI